MDYVQALWEQFDLQEMFPVDLEISCFYFNEHVGNLKSEYNFIKMISITNNSVLVSISLMHHAYHFQYSPGLHLTYVQKIIKVELLLSHLYFNEHVENLKQ